MESDYVLRERDDEEIHRLEFQHQVWKDVSDKAIELAAVQTKDKIIDLGSGPGYLSFDLLKELNEHGEINCIDNSEKFLNYINRQGHARIQTLNLDIRKGFASHFLKERVDKLFCRWVLLFNGEVDQIVEEAYKSLKKGGKFISIEYFDFQKIEVFPRSGAFRKVYEKVEELLLGNGGSPSIGGEIGEIMKGKGFSKIEQHKIYKRGKAGSPLWEWLAKTNENHTNLVQAGLIAQSDLDLYHEHWNERAKDEDAYLMAPPLMITIAEK